MAANVAVPKTFAEPSNAGDVYATSPFMDIVLAVANVAVEPAVPVVF